MASATSRGEGGKKLFDIVLSVAEWSRGEFGRPRTRTNLTDPKILQTSSGVSAVYICLIDGSGH